jgi:hypothetical protein
VNEGLTLYFLCGLDSQRAANIAGDDRASPAINDDPPQVMEITGLSMAAHPQLVLDRAEAEKVLCMLPRKYPEQVNLPGPMLTRPGAGEQRSKLGDLACERRLNILRAPSYRRPRTAVCR